MNFDQLKYYVETVQCQSINAAAKNLYINQSTLTVALKQLEREIGCQLLIRSHVGVKTTPMGRRVYFDALKILNIQNEWLQYATNLSSSPATVTVFALESLVDTVLNGISRKVSLEYPSISLNIQIRTPNEMLSDGSETISLTSAYADEKSVFLKNSPKEHWNVCVLLEDSLCVYVNGLSPLAQREALSLEEIRRLKLVLPAHPEAGSTPLNKMLQVSGNYFISSIENMLKLAAERNFATVLPHFLSLYPQYISLYGLKPVAIADFDTRIFYFLIYPPEPQLTKEQKQVISIIQSFFQNTAE